MPGPIHAWASFVTQPSRGTADAVIMSWQPISRQQLDALVRDGLELADDVVLDAWKAMRIEPQKWQCPPWGDAGGGFWAVAIRDGNVVWYNDIEGGFNTSSFERHGVIGEYLCNQGDFEEYLATLPEALAAVQWHTEPHRSPPEALAGPGRILKRQTTSWTLQPQVGSEWRARFRGAAEIRCGGIEYERLELSCTHPVLAHHHEPMVDLHFRGRASDPDALEAAIAAAVKHTTKGWRSLDDYRNRNASLADGYGQLVRAPISVASMVRRQLEDAGSNVVCLAGLRRRASGRCSCSGMASSSRRIFSLRKSHAEPR